MEDIPARQVKQTEVNGLDIYDELDQTLTEMSNVIPTGALNVFKDQLRIRKTTYQKELDSLTSSFRSESKLSLNAMKNYYIRVTSALRQHFIAKHKDVLILRPTNYLCDVNAANAKYSSYRSKDYEFCVRCMLSITKFIIDDLKTKGYECSYEYTEPYLNSCHTWIDGIIKITYDFTE